MFVINSFIRQKKISFGSIYLNSVRNCKLESVGQDSSIIVFFHISLELIMRYYHMELVLWVDCAKISIRKTVFSSSSIICRQIFISCLSVEHTNHPPRISDLIKNQQNTDTTQVWLIDKKWNQNCLRKKLSLFYAQITQLHETRTILMRSLIFFL